MEQQHTNDEIDLGLVFRKIGDLWRSFLVWIFNCIQFVLRNWIILLVLIGLGIGLGYLWQENSKTQKAAFVIVQTNGGSAHYMYNKIDDLMPVQATGAGKKYGFDPDVLPIVEVGAGPIVDIIALTENVNTDDRSLEEFLAQADFVDELLLSDIFLNQYRYHKLEITLTEDGNQATVDSLISYLNDNELLNKALAVEREETEQKILGHRKSIEGIDQLFLSFAETNGTDNPSFIFKNNETINLHKVLEEKKKIMQYIEDERVHLQRLDKSILPITNTRPYYKSRILDKKMIIAPLVLVFTFVFFFWLRNLYRRIKKLKNEKEV